MRIKIDKLVTTCESVNINIDDNTILEIHRHIHDTYCDKILHILVHCKDEKQAEVLLHSVLIYGYLDITPYKYEMNVESI